MIYGTGTQLDKGEKQVSKALVVSCTLMQPYVYGYNVS